MENQIKYRFRRMELEQFAMFEENYDKDVKEAQFQTEAQFSFMAVWDDGWMALLTRSF